MPEIAELCICILQRLAIAKASSTAYREEERSRCSDEDKAKRLTFPGRTTTCQSCHAIGLPSAPVRRLAVSVCDRTLRHLVYMSSERRRCRQLFRLRLGSSAGAGRWNLGGRCACLQVLHGLPVPEGGGGPEEFAEATGETRLTGDRAAWRRGEVRTPSQSAVRVLADASSVQAMHPTCDGTGAHKRSGRPVLRCISPTQTRLLELCWVWHVAEARFCFCSPHRSWSWSPRCSALLC
jgi:hypothetical protein